jgi:hypothetical protein
LRTRALRSAGMALMILFMTESYHGFREVNQKVASRNWMYAAMIAVDDFV